MTALVQIPFANSEYQAHFERPYIGFIGSGKEKVFEAVLTALLPFNLRLEDTEFITTGTPAAHKTIFKIPQRGVRFEFGAEEYRFSKERPHWATAEEDGQILLAAEQALMEGNDVKVVSCRVIVAMHLALLHERREAVLAPFMPEPFKVFMRERQALTYGNHLIFADGEVLLDFSAVFQNGIFLRFSSHFHGKPSQPEILAKVRDDQAALFGILGIEEATSA